MEVGGVLGRSEVVKVKLPLPPMTCLVMFMVPLRVLVKPQPTLPPAVTVKVAAPLALPPGPQLIAVWGKSRLPAPPLTGQVPGATPVSRSAGSPDVTQNTINA